MAGRGGAVALRGGAVALAYQPAPGRAVERSTDEPRNSSTILRQADAGRVGLDVHPRLDLAGAGRDQRPRARDLDHADAADVHRGEVLEVAERRRVDPLRPARLAGSSHDAGTLDRLAVDDDVDEPLARRRSRADGGMRGAAAVGTRRNRRSSTDSRSGKGSSATAPTRWHWTRSGPARRSRHRASPGRSPRAGPAPRPEPIGRPERSRCKQLFLAHGARRGRGRTGRTTRRGRTPRSARGCRRGRPCRRRPAPRPSRASRRSRASPRRSGACPACPARRRRRAAPPSSTARIAFPPRTPAGQRDQLAEGDAEIDLVHARVADVAGDAEELGPGRARRADRRRRPRRRARRIGGMFTQRLDVVDRPSACRRARTGPGTAACCAARRACLRSS